MKIEITEEQYSDFEDIIINLDGDPHRDYSGRGMYGESCIGFKTYDPMRAMFQLGIESEICDANVAWLQRANFRTDSMGKGTIVYFPNIKVTEDED